MLTVNFILYAPESQAEVLIKQAQLQPCIASSIAYLITVMTRLQITLCFLVTQLLCEL